MKRRGKSGQKPLKKDKKTIGFLVFIILCLAICLVPFAGMAVKPTTETSENRTLAEFPSVKTPDGKANKKFFSQFNTYFSDHFALRNELVYVDSRIQKGLFGMSAVDSVIAGSDDWLYYKATMNDYLGMDPLSETDVYGIARNLYLACQYTEKQGIPTVVAIPPNKNTIHGEHMPYYATMIAEPYTHVIDRLRPLLDEMGVPHADLVDMLREESKKEVLYLKRDSHWNNKGALLAYDLILDELGKRHDDYSGVAVARRQDADGDLNRMVYTFYGDKEMDTYYDLPAYEITNDATSVEDMRYNTSSEGKDNLLMFRDSFANALIPFFAPQFEESVFTKEAVYALEKQIETVSPDYIVMEKAERVLTDYLKMPPIFSAESVEAPVTSGATDTDTSVELSTSGFDIDYYELRGSIDPEVVSDHSDYLIQINDTCYEAYHTENNGFVLYQKKIDAPAFPWKVKVMVRNGDEVQTVKETEICE